MSIRDVVEITSRITTASWTSKYSRHTNNSNPAPDNTTSFGSNTLTEPVLLQHEAYYKEYYGNAYVDQLVKYLYPVGYQSMRPAAGRENYPSSSSCCSSG